MGFRRKRMKAILEFNLEDQDDVMAHKRCVKALDMGLVLWEIQYKLGRRVRKEDISSDDLMEEIINLIEEYNINIDELII